MHLLSCFDLFYLLPLEETDLRSVNYQRIWTYKCIGFKLISCIELVLWCHVYKIPKLAACPAHFPSHQHKGHQGGPLMYQGLTYFEIYFTGTPGITSYLYYPLRAVMVRSIYFPMRQSLRCGFHPWFTRRFLPPLDRMRKIHVPRNMYTYPSLRTASLPSMWK